MLLVCDVIGRILIYSFKVPIGLTSVVIGSIISNADFAKASIMNRRFWLLCNFIFVLVIFFMLFALRLDFEYVLPERLL